MREQGEVRKIVDGRAHVLVKRDLRGCCAGCATCTVDGVTAEVVVPAVPGLKPRDRVVLEVPTVSTLRAAVLLFLVPVFLLVGGAVVLHALLTGGDDGGQINVVAAGIALAATIAWYIGVMVFDRRSRANPERRPRIVERLPAEPGRERPAAGP